MKSWFRPNYNETAFCNLFLALPMEKRAKGCTARIVPNYSGFRKRNPFVNADKM